VGDGRYLPYCAVLHCNVVAVTLRGRCTRQTPITKQQSSPILGGGATSNDRRRFEPATHRHCFRYPTKRQDRPLLPSWFLYGQDLACSGLTLAPEFRLIQSMAVEQHAILASLMQATYGMGE
ncbi:hypothetical protein PoMZ_12783, partial [Pyricularia oryzae]